MEVVVMLLRFIEMFAEPPLAVPFGGGASLLSSLVSTYKARRALGVFPVLPPLLLGAVCCLLLPLNIPWRS